MFVIKILKQYWVDGDPDNTDDLCSHGLIYLKINDMVITDEKDDDWTVSTTALQLLRTLKTDRELNSDEPMIQHCGQLGFCGCPISIDWSTKLKDDKIVISDIQKVLTTNETDVIKYDLAQTEIDISLYAKFVLCFSEEVIKFFKNHKPVIDDEYDRELNISFWEEYNKLFKELNNKFV